MILLIDNYDSFTYNLYQQLLMQQVEVKVIRNDDLSVSQIAALQPAGIVISPGPGRPDDAGICLDVIKELYTKIPMLGVCLGQQAIAQAFGGKVVCAPEIVHGKQSLVFHPRNGIFVNMPLPFNAARYHSLIVERASLPDCLQITADDGDQSVMALAHKEYPVYGVQFHPESILTEEGDSLIAEFVKLCEAEHVAA